MKCPNCNQEVEASAVFCGNCGHQLQQAVTTESAEPTEPVEPVEAEPGTEQPPMAPAEIQAPALEPAPIVADAPQPPIAPAAPVPPQAPQLPGYATDQTKPDKDSKLLTLAVVFAALSVPGALIPIVGLGFGIAAIVLAAKHHHAGTGRMVTAIVIASLGALLSLASWGYNISQHVKQTGLAPGGSLVASVTVVERSVVPYQTLVTVNR